MLIAVVIPCYRVTRHVLEVIAAIGPEVGRIYCVDDACPDHSGDFIADTCRDPRVRVLHNPQNLGVGGAVMTGYRQAIADGARPSDLHRPGHVFPLRARTGGVLTRRGHTEATVDLMQLASLKPYGVLCELTKADGSMARLPDLVAFGRQHRMPVLTIEDLVQYRQMLSERSA